MRKQPRSRTSRIVVPIVFIFLGGLVVAILFPVFAPGRYIERKTACLSNIKQLTLAVIMYQTDVDDRLPPANTWCDRLDPYVKNKQLFESPDLIDHRKGKCGYAYRSRLSWRPGSDFDHPASEPAVFDSSDLSWNANGPLTLAPSPGRHGKDVNVFGMLDGHARYATLEQLVRLHRQSPIN